MKNKKILPIVTVAIIASQLCGCACSSKDELHKMIEKGEQIEIEVAEPDFEEQGTETQITWTELAKLANYADFRLAFEQILGISSASGIKNGIAYINLDGKTEQNNTLYNAFMNKSFVENYWNNEKVQQAAKMAASENYADVEADSETAKYAAVNAYWNLLPDNEPNFFNGGASLSRAEAMTLLMRATTPVSELSESTEFESSVGESDYAEYASYVENSCYLTTADKSLNNQTFNSSMSRAEYIYMIVNAIFGSENVSNTDISGISLNDCKVTTEKHEYKSKDYVKSYDLSYTIASPENGLPEEIYKAIAFAKKYDIISAETAWDEAITREDAIAIFADTMIAYANSNGYKVEDNTGEIDTESIEEKARVAYNRIADKISISVDTYIKEYKSIIKQGSTHEQAEAQLADIYSQKEVQATEPETEAPNNNDNNTVSDPTKLPAVGNYTETLTNHDMCIYTRTYENGAIRYVFIDPVFKEVYEIPSPNEVPEYIINEWAKKLDALYEDEGQNQQSTTQSNNNNSGQTSTTQETTEDYSDYENNLGDNSGYDPNYKFEGDIAD